jgi:succinate dehydrogenase flavin-adding protein (antitoxin of CptAB toxin-antitoxin module)
MRELDILLERYLENIYTDSSDDDKSAFQQLLTLSDPDLAGYLLRDDRHADVLISNVIDQILGRAAP